MVDVGFSHALEDCPKSQVQEKYLYLEAHASKALSSVLSAEVEDMIKIEYDLFETINILWKALEQKYMAQIMIRGHHQQMYQRISHHHLCTLIKITGSNQASKKGKVIKSGKIGWSGFPNRMFRFWKNRSKVVGRR
jgi:hypothetical protein